jgi:erythromycin esterase-like protein
VIQQLRDLNRRAGEQLAGSTEDRADLFYAQQNARLVRNAEEYYRTMFHGRVSSWNLRDSHMVETLQALDKHLTGLTGNARMIVWAHNSHLGDASATEMGDIGEWNVGQLARDRWGDDALLVGFSTHHGTVTAASEWDAPAQRKRVRPGLAGSYEDLFHQAGERFWLPLRGNPALAELLRERRLQRAIGVIYLPQSERTSHYFHTDLPAQFDALIHIDETKALQPLVAEPAWHAGEPAETYPTGL